MLSSIEKEILIKKYKKEGLSYDQIKNHLTLLKMNINYSKKVSKKPKDENFKESFAQLYQRNYI